MSTTMRSTARYSEKLDDSTADRLVGMTSLIQDDVYDAAHNCLGKVREIILDARTGCVRYVVLALGGFLGIGRKRFAVPWSAFTLDANYHRCIVDVTLMQLTAVRVPENEPWLQRVHRTSSNVSAYLPRRPLISDALPTRRSTFLELRLPETETTRLLPNVVAMTQGADASKE